MLSSALKRGLVRLITHRWLAPALAPLVQGRGTILMLHRFADAANGIAGHDPERLRATLAALRQARRELVPVDEIARRARAGSFGRSAPIAFTVDDGYADFARVAAPIFAEFSCPVTVFLVTGVLDERGWYWWDRITASMRACTRRELSLDVGGMAFRRGWNTEDERHTIEAELMEALKRVSVGERQMILDELPGALGVALPPTPPPRFAAMTWDDVRQCAAGGATFGAHTVSHPILAQLDDASARDEIATSWRRVGEETNAISSVFCYPNGTPHDFGAREAALVRDAGMDGAVSTVPGYVSPGSLSAMGPDAMQKLPRFGYPDAPHELSQILGGLERVKMALRARG